MKLFFFFQLLFIQTMFHCNFCNLNITTNDVFIKHTQLMHKFELQYICGYKDCYRKYTTIRFLKKHVKLCHSDETNCVSLSSEVVNPNDKLSCNVVVSNDDLHMEGSFQCNNNNVQSNVFKRNFDVTRFQMFILKQSTLYLSQLYARNSVTRSVVDQVVNETGVLFDTILDQCHQNLFHLLKNNIQLSEAVLESITEMFNCARNPFHGLGSEHLRLKYFQECKAYIKPESITVCEFQGPVKHRRSIKFGVGKFQVQFIPLRDVLKAFLELPQVFNLILSYVKDSSQSMDVISSILEGNIWKTIVNHYGDKTVFPLYLYFDEFEPGNPLGSRAGAHKLGGVYCSLACLPPQFASKLENIFLVQIFETRLLKLCTQEEIFNRLIIELKFLESNGIEVVLNGQKYQVFFSLIAILGDNAGLNYMLGFSESFSANYYCRICRESKAECSRLCIETDNLRNLENYYNDLQHPCYGVKVECIWNKLQLYRNVINFSLDIMHDFHEGVCRYDLGLILYRFIEVEKRFTLDQLNNRVDYFNHLSDSDVGNSIPLIKHEHLHKQHIAMSASEMNAFVTYLPFIVGDLVDEGNPIWHFYIILYNIMQICFGKKFNRTLLSYLKEIIKEHHFLYLQLFAQPLKPKHHFMTHYPSVIALLGPPRYYSSVRYEAFHRISKIKAHIVSSRVNIAYTLAVNHQLRFCHRLLSKHGFESRLECGSSTRSTFNHLGDNGDECYVSWVKQQGILYKEGQILLLGISAQSWDELPVFGRIVNILVKDDDTIAFIVELINVIGYFEHFEGYVIESDDNLRISKIELDKLACQIPMNEHLGQNGTTFVSTNVLKMNF